MGKWFAGLMLGAIVGAATGFLLAPQSGAALKGGLQRRWAEIMEEGRRAAAERRAELEAQFAEAKRMPQPGQR